MNARLAGAVALALTAVGLSLFLVSRLSSPSPRAQTSRPVEPAPKARNAIFFVGDGMGVSTVTAARIFSVGVAGELCLDQMPYTAVSRTYTADYITGDSAGTMTSMVTGQKANSGMLGLDATTERADILGDGDGARLTTVFELAKQAGKKIGLVTTAGITHATPAACYAKVNDRELQTNIALQLLPGDPAYNPMLGDGIDVLMGGGRWFFLPGGVQGPEGEGGRRHDQRDLVQEFQAAGYQYCWNTATFDRLQNDGRKVLGLFEAEHMEYEHDRPNDVGGEPSLQEMAIKALELLEDAEEGYLLLVEGGRIDHAHHAGNPYRALVETVAFDRTLAAILERVDLDDTLVLATADHSHVFNIAGYPLRPLDELSYDIREAPANWKRSKHSGLLGLAHGTKDGRVGPSQDLHGMPYTALVYANGPGYRRDLNGQIPTGPLRGFGGAPVTGPDDPDFLPVAAVPLSSETHGGEDVIFYGIGAGADRLHGTVDNTFAFRLLTEALGLD